MITWIKTAAVYVSDQQSALRFWTEQRMADRPLKNALRLSRQYR